MKEGQGDERMRGDDNQQEGMFSYISPEKRVPGDHPLRPIRKMVDEILKEMSPRFAKLYSDVGRPSIAPARLFRSLLVQIFYSVRSLRMLIEQLHHNLLFRWSVVMETRNGRLLQTFQTEANGRAERDAALLMAEGLASGKRVTMGGDKAYDTQEFVRERRGMNITRHVAQNTTNRRSAVDERTTRHAGYEGGQRKRKQSEQSFGWMQRGGMVRRRGKLRQGRVARGGTMGRGAGHRARWPPH